MIYAINYNDNELAGRVTLKGTCPKILNEYRLLTRVLMDWLGPEEVIKWTAGLAHDDISKVTIDLDIRPETGGEYIPEEVKVIEGS